MPIMPIKKLMSIKPIFVLGAAHSGTTILYKMLALHPDTAWISQWSLRNGIIKRKYLPSHLPGYSLGNRWGRNLKKHSWIKQSGPMQRLLLNPLQCLLPNPCEGSSVWNYCIPEDEGLNRAKQIERMHRVFTQECRDWHRDHLLLKAPRLLFHLPVLYHAFPEGKFIHIKRNGSAVALSDAHKFERDQSDELIALRQSAQYWHDSIASFEENKHQLDYIELQYEAFCSDIHGHLRTLLNFSGLSLSSFPFSILPETLTVTNYNWFAKLPDSKRQVLEEIFDPDNLPT